MGATRKPKRAPSYAMQIQLPKFVSSNAIIIEIGFPPLKFTDTMYPLFARKRSLFAFKAVTISVYSLKSRFKCVANGLLFYTLTSSNVSPIPSGMINVICRLLSLKSTTILLLITLHMSPYKFVYDAACHCSPIDSNFNTPTPSYPRTNIALGSLYLFTLPTYG